MDKAEIFHELTRRNALRREAKLPLLDLAVEFEWECLAAARRDYEIECAKHADVRQAILLEEIAAWTERTGSPPRSIAGYYIGPRVNRRFDDYMRSIGVEPVKHAPSRNAIIYGSRPRAAK